MRQSVWLDFLGADVRVVQGKQHRSRIVEAGAGNAETLIMTHPGGGHLETFACNIVPLGRHLHAVGLEMIWHGFSSTPPIGEDRIAQEGGQVIDVLDAIGVEKAWVHGTASGGVVPTWLAMHHPERLKGIIYQATTAGVDVKLDPPRAQTRVGGMSIRDHMLQLLKEPNYEGVRERLLHTVHPANAALITDELIAIRMAIYQRPEANAAMVRYYNDNTQLSVSEEALAKVGLPVLVLAGDVTEQAMAGPRRLASVIPGARFEVIERTGLWSHFESPDTFNQLVLEFILGSSPG